jgi:hypothetical protein
MVLSGLCVAASGQSQKSDRFLVKISRPRGIKILYLCGSGLGTTIA